MITFEAFSQRICWVPARWDRNVEVIVEVLGQVLVAPNCWLYTNTSPTACLADPSLCRSLLPQSCAPAWCSIREGIVLLAQLRDVGSCVYSGWMFLWC